MLTRRFQTLLLALALAALPAVALGQAKGQLPYATVNSYLDLFQSLAHLDRIIPSMMVVSTNPGVSPQAIELKMKTDEGWRVFSPDENGVIDFPAMPDSADHNLITNQPKGTLQLVIGFRARPLESTSTTYQELMGLVQQFDEALTALADARGNKAPRKVKGLTIQMSESSGAQVNIMSGKRQQSMKSNSKGLIIMKYRDALWQENPRVELDEIPLGILPLQ